jgi:large subunit ribosomal protein L18
VNHIYAQIIDDQQGHTIVAAASTEKDLRGKGGNVDGAKQIGKAVAERAKSKGVTKVVFDRGGYQYHGRVKALADAAREAGLEF